MDTTSPGHTGRSESLVANAELRRLIHEEQSLRNVATLVAAAGPYDDILTAICRAASDQVDGQDVTLIRFESADTIVAVATHGGTVPPGTRVVHPPGSLSERVARTKQPVRIDDFAQQTSASIVRKFGIRAGVGVPIFIEGHIWGMFTATSQTGPLPARTENRLEGFAQLTWAAIANTEARESLKRLVEQQAALRDIAELVARESALSIVFQSVVEKAAHILNASAASIHRHADAESRAASVVARFEQRHDPVAARTEAPILVDGEAWGTLIVASAATGDRLGRDQLKPFADLTAAAIANSQHREGLTQSRARVIAAADDARRRLQRDVHDGAQQRLVHTIITLRLARDRAEAGGSVGELLAEALSNAEEAQRQLRDIVRGILPASLTRAGLVAGVRSIVADTPIPVVMKLDVPRMSAVVETTGYFVVAEAVTNAVKHAHATRIVITGAVTDEHTELIVIIEDDGVGGAEPMRGTGLMGLRDRIEAGNGAIDIHSPPGGGTRITVRIPLVVAGNRSPLAE
jgi:signal transduction histidine kinase